MSGACRILCIEDDARLRRLLAEDLTEAGYEVTTSGNAADGLLAFFRNAPHLVLCDIRMPGRSGFDFFRALRQLDSAHFGVAFVFLTALADRDNELTGRRLGADDYITKPVDYDILREVIRVRLNGRAPGRTPEARDEDFERRLAEWFALGAPPPPASLVRDAQARLRAESQPAVSGVPRNIPPRGGSEWPAAALGDMVDGLALGIIIADRNGRAHYINESAAICLGGRRDQFAGQISTGETDFLVNRHWIAADPMHPHISAERIDFGRGGEPMTVVARCTRDETGEVPRVTLLLPLAPPDLQVSGAMLTALFGLTPAERALACAIAEGVTLADYSAARGVAIHTVRTQLKSVFGKLGVARQAELVRLVVALQVGLPA